MPCFARDFGCFMVCSEIAECGKSKQNLASYYYLLVVKLVVKRKGLLLRIYYFSQPIPIGVPSDEKGTPILANNSSAFSYSAS